MKSKKKYKDQCDNCGKYDYCKGFDDQVLCPVCLKKVKTKEKQRKKDL
nr:MAG TPA: DNA-directed RNA polymerase [Caudoviricetes sp.]